MASIHTESFKLGFVGAGKMAESIAKGIVKSGILPASRIRTAHKDFDRRDAFSSFGVKVFEHNHQVVEDSDVVIFSVKPQVVKEVVLQLKPLVAENKLLVSVAAGIKLSDLQEWADSSRFIIRVLPNTPAAVGQAATGYLQSFFGVYSIRIENVGVRRPSSDDVQIQGIANPRGFRKAVLTRLANMKSENFSRQVSRNEDLPNFGMGYSPAAWIRQDTGAGLASAMSPSKSLRHDQLSSSGELILQKLEEVGSSMKRVQSLIEEQKCTHSQPIE